MGNPYSAIGIGRGKGFPTSESEYGASAGRADYLALPKNEPKLTGFVVDPRGVENLFY